VEPESGLPLSFSSTLASAECVASFVLYFLLQSMEQALCSKVMAVSRAHLILWLQGAVCMQARMTHARTT
jgi:hypothetical protein